MYVLETLYGGQLHNETQVIKPNYLCKALGPVVIVDFVALP